MSQRHDVPLSDGKTLVLVLDGPHFFARLLGLVDGRQTFLTPKLPIRPGFLEVLRSHRSESLDLGGLVLAVDHERVTVTSYDQFVGERGEFNRAAGMLMVARERRPG